MEEQRTEERDCFCGCDKYKEAVRKQEEDARKLTWISRDEDDGEYELD